MRRVTELVAALRDGYDCAMADAEPGGESRTAIPGELSASPPSGAGDDRGPAGGWLDPNLPETLVAFSDLRYRDLFWPRRRYEDSADRIALRAFLPSSGERLIEAGAGFGRLSDEYRGYREVVLLDASEPLLRAARERLGSDPRFTIVEGDAFELPFPDASFDAAVCIRVLHHFEDPRPAIVEFARVLRPGGVLVVEFANKRNLRAIVARMLGRLRWSPVEPGTRAYEDISLPTLSLPRARRRPSAGGAGGATGAPRWTSSTSFLHAPADMRSWLRSAGFTIDSTRSIGLFRLPFLTGHLPLGLLVRLERIQQPVLGSVTFAPSVCIRATRRGEPPRGSAPAAASAAGRGRGVGADVAAGGGAMTRSSRSSAWPPVRWRPR